MGGKCNWGFSQDDGRNLDDTQSQPAASEHVVEHHFKDTEKMIRVQEG